MLPRQCVAGGGMIELVSPFRPVHHLKGTTGVVAVAAKARLLLDIDNLVMIPCAGIEPDFEFPVATQTFFAACTPAKLVAVGAVLDSLQGDVRPGQRSRRDLGHPPACRQQKPQQCDRQDNVWRAGDTCVRSAGLSGTADATAWLHVLISPQKIHR